jgi:putative Mg2+ transporter-C (MgtC) family protein
MVRMLDPASELDQVLRLVLAAVLGAAIGVERELHDHPAGMRTHLLVAVGSALFTVLSAHGFGDLAGGAAVDPSRVAAQIVTGIGFLGAGAIIKEGFTVRGLTTAASLWVTAAIGMAAAVSEPIGGVAATALVLVSLWPLTRIADRLRARRIRAAQLRVELDDLDALESVIRVAADAGSEVVGLDVSRREDGVRVATLDLRVRGGAEPADLVRRTVGLPGVRGAGSGGQD